MAQLGRVFWASLDILLALWPPPSLSPQPIWSPRPRFHHVASRPHDAVDHVPSVPVHPRPRFLQRHSSSHLRRRACPARSLLSSQIDRHGCVYHDSAMLVNLLPASPASHCGAAIRRLPASRSFTGCFQHVVGTSTTNELTAFSNRPYYCLWRILPLLRLPFASGGTQGFFLSGMK